MPRPKKQKKNKEIEVESELYKILWALHNSIDKTSELVKYLEDIPEGSKSHDFYISYTVALFQEYIKEENDREMMFAACGFLKGFEFKPQKLNRRMREYGEHAKHYNIFFEKALAGSSFSTTCRNELRRITIKLEKILLDKLAKNEKGTLDFIANVPKRLELPEPRSIPIDEDKKKEENLASYVEEIIIDTKTDPSKIVIIQRFANHAENVFSLLKSNKTPIKIISFFLVIAVASSFWIDEYRRDYHLHDSQKETGFTTSIKLEDTDKAQKTKIEGEISEFEPLPPDAKIYD